MVRRMRTGCRQLIGTGFRFSVASLSPFSGILLKMCPACREDRHADRKIPVESTALVERLLHLIERLYSESDGFIDHPEETQLWYNRGYANGMIQVLDELGFGAALDGGVKRDPVDLIAGMEILAWGKAYLHGIQVGRRETREVMLD